MSDLEKRIFEFLTSNPESSGRAIGRAIGVDKSEVNSCLYRNEKSKILFKKKGLTPPLWSCIQSVPKHKPADELTKPLESITYPSENSIREIEDRSTNAIPTNLNPQRMTILGRTDYYGFTVNEDDEDLTDL